MRWKTEIKYTLCKMATVLTFSKSVYNILKVSRQEDESAPRLLYGRLFKGEVKVTACIRCTDLLTEKVVETALQSKTLLPAGDDIVGISVIVEKDNKEDIVKKSSDILKTLGVLEPIVVCLRKVSGGTEISEIWTSRENGDQQQLDNSVSEDSFLLDRVIGRTVFNIPLSFSFENAGSGQTSLHSEIVSKMEDINNGNMVYHLQKSNVLLGSDCCYGIEDNVSCDKLFKYIEEEEADGRSSKRSTKKSVKCLNFTGYTDMSSDQSTDSIPSCSPIIIYKTGSLKKVSMMIGIDVITVFDPSTPVRDMCDRICKSVTSQLQAVEACICKFSKGETFVTPVPYHYQPLNLQTLVTILHPHSIPDDQLESYRREIHHILCLPDDRPLFRRVNQFVFPGSEDTGGYLVNIHEGLTGSKVVGGTQSVVSGLYTYHHYMQDRFDDNKWGCAYRSLQTLVSWFKLQGYTNRDIPAHREIQQTLVDIGDKEPKFVGSRQWIGSMEVSFVLDTLLGVSCKILSVSCGSDMASKGRELSSHFTTQGTPVMIGGGVLAHTILGVDYNEVTGDIAFLILDPHYTGSEDKKVILDKGWCGWKGPEFWDQHAHYNMCLPQRPNVI